MPNLVEIRKATPGEIPFTRNTCYKFHSQKKYPQMILRVGNKLFFDLDEWQKMIAHARNIQVDEAKELRKQGRCHD